MAIAMVLPQERGAAKPQPGQPEAAVAPAKAPVHSGQNPQPVPRANPARSGVQGVQFDNMGYPIVPDDLQRPLMVQPPAAPSGETAANRTPPKPQPLAPAGVATGTARPTPPRPALEARSDVASGMQLGSPLLEIYQHTQSPGAFKELGGVIVAWQLTTYGERGEEIGSREVTHTADCAFAERDRLEYSDGRTYGRVSSQVYAERQGMPAPTMVAAAQQELVLFGTQLRMPWLFADARLFAVMGRDVDEREGERLARVVVERRPPPSLDLLGPPVDQPVRDRYELFFEPSTGLPREFVHRLAASKQARRVLLEDWREVEGVRMPFRRAYVSESMRVTTLMTIKSIEKLRVTDRDFRLH